MTHTPGPWRFEGNRDIVASGDGYTFAVCSLVEARFAKSPPEYVALHGDVIEANAHLILAAPEMAAVLQAMISFIEKEAEQRIRKGQQTLMPMHLYGRAKAALILAGILPNTDH
jgi:hypothetical protein